MAWLYEANDIDDLRAIISAELQWIEKRLRGNQKRVLQSRSVLRLKHREILLRHSSAKQLRASCDVCLDRIAARALKLWRYQRCAIDPVSDSDLILRLVDVRAGAEAGAAENLATALLALSEEARVGIGQKLALRRTNRRIRGAAIVDCRQMDGIVAAREVDRLVQRQCRALSGSARCRLC